MTYIDQVLGIIHDKGLHWIQKQTIATLFEDLQLINEYKSKYEKSSYIEIFADLEKCIEKEATLLADQDHLKKQTEKFLELKFDHVSKYILRNINDMLDTLKFNDDYPIIKKTIMSISEKLIDNWMENALEATEIFLDKESLSQYNLFIKGIFVFSKYWFFEHNDAEHSLFENNSHKFNDKLHLQHQQVNAGDLTMSSIFEKIDHDDLHLIGQGDEG